MEYVRSNRGAFKLIHGNHVYVKQKVLKNGAVCWECEQRRNKVACKAKLHVLNDFVTCKLCDLKTLYFYVLEILLSGGGNCPGVFVLGGNCPGGNCPGVIVQG